MKMYLEFIDGASSKFWEVEVVDTNVNVRYGKIGTAGQATQKSFATEADAQKEATKLAAAKTRKGYIEKDAPAATAQPATPIKAKAAKPAATPAAPPDPKSIEKGVWILMSYDKYVETYNEKPLCNEDIGCNETTAFLVNPSNAVFEGNFYTDPNRTEFGTIENPENIDVINEQGGISTSASYRGIVVVVKGDMVVNGNFIDDLGQITCEVQVAVAGTLYAKNLTCDETYFYINNAQISGAFVALGNDGSYDGKTITATYYREGDHDVRAKAKSIYKGDPEKLVNKGIIRNGGHDAYELAKFIEKGEPVLFSDQRYDTDTDQSYWLRMVSMSTPMLNSVPTELLDEEICLAAILNATKGYKTLFQKIPKQYRQSKEFLIQVVVKSFDLHTFVPAELQDEVIKKALAIKDYEKDRPFLDLWGKTVRDIIDRYDVAALKAIVEKYSFDLNQLSAAQYGLPYTFAFVKDHLILNTKEVLDMWNYLLEVCDIHYSTERYGKSALEWVPNLSSADQITPALADLFKLPIWTTEDYDSALCRAILKNKIVISQWMIDNNFSKPENIDNIWEFGSNLANIKFIVEHGAPIKSNVTLIHNIFEDDATADEKIEAVNYLRDNGFDFSVSADDKTGIIKYDEKQWKLITLLIEYGADPNATCLNSCGTPLYYAFEAYNGYRTYAAIEMLLSRGADFLCVIQWFEYLDFRGRYKNKKLREVVTSQWREKVDAKEVARIDSILKLVEPHCPNDEILDKARFYIPSVLSQKIDYYYTIASNNIRCNK